MASTVEAVPTEQRMLQDLAQRHLWMHFTRMGAYDEEAHIPIIVRGVAVLVVDVHTH